MSTLRTTEVDKLDGTYFYETKQIESKRYNFDWTIPNFNHLKKNPICIEKPFSSSENRSEPGLFFKVDTINYHGPSNKIVFTLNSKVLLARYIESVVYLKSLDHVYEFSVNTLVRRSAEWFKFSLNFQQLSDHMEWNDDNIPHDLTISCKISIADSMEDFLKEKKINFNDDEDISDHRNSILDDDSFKDFSFVIQDQTFHVSKFLLALESPFFAAMFKSKMSEGLNSEAIITDTEPEIFKKMIQFIYDQKVDKAELEKSAPQLLKIAHKYDVKKLKKVCNTFLYDKLCVNNALEILLLADQYSMYGLKKEALRIIKMNLKLFQESENFKNFMKQRLSLVLELMDFNEKLD